MPHLQSKVQWCITVKARLHKCLFIKVRLEFLLKNVGVSYHPKVQTVPFCRSGEREFCTQSGFQVAAGACACWTQTRSTTVFCWRAHHKVDPLCAKCVEDKYTVEHCLWICWRISQSTLSSTSQDHRCWERSPFKGPLCLCAAKQQQLCLLFPIFFRFLFLPYWILSFETAAMVYFNYHYHGIGSSLRRPFWFTNVFTAWLHHT